MVEANSVVGGIPQSGGLGNVLSIGHHVAQSQHPGEASEGDIVTLQVGLVSSDTLLRDTYKNKAIKNKTRRLSDVPVMDPQIPAHPKVA